MKKYKLMKEQRSSSVTCRVLALLTVLALMCALLASCGGSEETPDGTEATGGKTYTVTYVANGETVNTVTVSESDAAIYVVATYEGEGSESFLGWNDGTFTYQAGALMPLSSDVTLTAVFDTPAAVEYTVTYMANGNNLSTVKVSKEDAASYTVMAYTGADSASFVGWSDGTTTYQAGDTLALTKSMTLTAVFDTAEEVTYTVTYLVNGVTYKTETVAEADAATYAVAAYTGADSASFLGWSDGSATYQAGNTLALTKNVTLTAVFETADDGVTEYTVTYVANGATVKTVTVAAADAANYTVEGYTDDDSASFIGWSDGTTTYQAGDKVTLSKNMTLTAIFESSSATQYKVTYVADGLTVMEVTVPGSMLSSYSVMAYTGDNSEKFLGWSDGTTTYVAGDTIALRSDLTLTAVFDTTSDENTDGLEGTYATTDGFSSFTLDGKGVATSGSNTGSYTYNQTTGIITITGLDSSLCADYTYSENGGVLKQSLWGTETLYIKEGYQSPDQKDSMVSGKLWISEDGYTMIIDAANNQVTVAFNNDTVDGTYTYTENYNGSTLNFTANNSRVWTVTVTDASNVSLRYRIDVYSTARMKVAATVTLKAEGQTDIQETVYPGSYTLSANTFTIEGKIIVGWTDGTNEYEADQSISLSGDITLTAVLEDESEVDENEPTEGGLAGTFEQQGNTSYKITLDGNGGVTATSYTTFTGTYTYDENAGTVIITITGDSYSEFGGTFTCKEDGNVLYKSSSAIYIKSGYTSPNQKDSAASDKIWAATNGYKLTIDAENNQITVDFGNDTVDGTYTYTETYDGGVLTFTVSSRTWTLTIGDGSMSLRYRIGSASYTTATFTEATAVEYTVTYVANGSTFSTATVAEADAAAYTVIAYTGDDSASFLGWSDGSNTYQAGDTLALSDDVTLTAVFEGSSEEESDDGLAGTYQQDGNSSVKITLDGAGAVTVTAYGTEYTGTYTYDAGASTLVITITSTSYCEYAGTYTVASDGSTITQQYGYSFIKL